MTRFARLGTVVLTLSVGLLVSADEPRRGPRSPAEERASFRLADPELEIELVAAEPVISSPVAISWDADGQMYVAEMIGYPLTTQSCQIAILADSNGNGRFQRLSTFADGLSFVTSVMPYRGGVFVASAPDLMFLEDTDRDGKADLQRVEWTGFATQSQQLRFNALHLGLDNWIYGANGRSDGEIRRPNSSAETAVSIRTRDFRFQPRSGAFEPIVGQSQFGQVHDDWGNRFLSWNTIPIRHVVIDDRYLSHSPRRVAEAVVDLADPNDSGRVFPISSSPPQFNSEQPNYYNAMCGLTIYRGDRLGAEYSGNAFVGESLSNLVTRRKLEPMGPTFVGRRAPNEQQQEFLASSDGWFHPVFLTTGPDGCLYVVDFYREFVEHPIYVANLESRAKTDWRSGANHGRIWRIRRKVAIPEATVAPGALISRTPHLASATTTELVRHLEHPNGWWRDTAQRLIVERHDPQAQEPLQNLARTSRSPGARIHALWTLEGIDALDDAILLDALKDPHADVRRQAIRLAESQLDRPSALHTGMLALTGDAEKRVRFQLALALASNDTPESVDALVAILGQAEDRWLSLAVLCATSRAPGQLFVRLAERADWLHAPSTSQAWFLQQLGEQLAISGEKHDLTACAEWLAAANDELPQYARIALLAGLVKGLQVSNGDPRSLRLPAVPPQVPGSTVEKSSLPFSIPLVRAAGRTALQVDVDPMFRGQAIDVLAWHGRFGVESNSTREPTRKADHEAGETARTGQLLVDLLLPSNPPQVQSAAARALAMLDHLPSNRTVYERWPRLGAVARREVVAVAQRSSSATEALLHALEEQFVLPMELPPGVRSGLAESRDPKTKERATKLLAGATQSERQRVVAEYQQAIRMAGDVRRGAALAKQHCLSCHVIHGLGVRIGPDLTGIGSRRNDILLTDILDPGRNVTPDFVNFVVSTTRGQVFAGILTNETAESITLRRGGGELDTISRSDVSELRSTGKSLMPDGFEEKLTLQQAADLLEFLRRSDRELLQSAPD